MQFSDLPLNHNISLALESRGIKELTPVQEQSLPHLLEGKDVVAKAKTGSGKTIAFGAAIINRVRARHQQAQALVLCPTRELATQVAEELKKLAARVENIKILTLCGGVGIGPQINSLSHGTDIIVGTPGRIADLERKGKLRLDSVEMLVLDEADRMLDMGFIDAIDQLIKLCSNRQQTLLFSATFPKEIEALSSLYQKNPQLIEVADAEHSSHIEEEFIDARNADSHQQLIHLLSHEQPASAIIFCNTIATTKAVNKLLYQNGFIALALHGDLEQRQRDETIIRFANRSTQILVATDVAARGLDIDDVELVINFELSRQLSTHTHRIGRTGRAGKEGKAYTFIAHNRQLEVLESKRGELNLTELDDQHDGPMPRLPDFVTIELGAGKKDKIRKGDVLGAITGDGGFKGAIIGKIDSLPFQTFVAIERSHARQVLSFFQQGKIKGRNLKCRRF